MRIADRKVVELGDKLAGVTTEFASWLAEAGEGRPLRKHQTQLIRLTDQLDGLVGAVAGELDAARRDGADILEVGRDLQLRILEVHRVWDFFRSKFGLRYVAWFRDHLSAMDEFAWECLEPAAIRDRRPGVPAAAVKAPPLVFLTGQFSPFLHAGSSPFDVEAADDAPDSLEFLQLVTALPVPVIGLPWYQLTHLPDAVLVAHEIGHDVERTFGLEPTTINHLRGVQAKLSDGRRAGWFGWLREIFADLYGVLAAGPAYVSALIDLLAADPDRITDEPVGPPWLTHPPAAVRIAVCTAALAAAEIGFVEQAKQLREAWADTYPAAAGSAVAPFADEVELVVAALLTSPYPQFGTEPVAPTLPGVVSFTAQQQADAVKVVKQVAGGMAPTSVDVRCLVAAARLAFQEAPGSFRTAPRDGKSPQELILNRITALIDDRPRSRAAVERSAPEPVDDRAAGAALAALLPGRARATARTADRRVSITEEGPRP